MTKGWRSSPELDKVAAALVAALPELEDVRKDKEGVYGKYADLAGALSEARGKLGKHDLALFQSVHGGPQQVTVETTIMHSSGQWISFAPLVLNAGNTAMAIGSATTYGRRYTSMAALGLAAEGEDDDGKAANSEDKPGRKAPPRRRDTTPSRPPANAEGEPLVTDAQLRKIHAIYGGAGIRDDAEKRRISAHRLGLDDLPGDPPSHNNLTREQARELIDAISQPSQETP